MTVLACPHCGTIMEILGNAKSHQCDCGGVMEPNALSQADARAYADAGIMPLPEYLRLCEKNGWKPQIPGGA